ncbi:L-lysine 6-monooxygenase [Micromonospora qiuiae]|uniref:L-lysine N6-monooxygenase MbtG n=1 Tax=Micromonospora qiuiae TaxID=502268 RepID=A0ABQ4JFQ6_9ACTN|nr:SidA/IucD/PvdA family monooxygenase [Micromonospora qiuiae]GIJ29218.1 L-lysine 6-monooxygenase [Micromonospora qiuiae]
MRDDDGAEVLAIGGGPANLSFAALAEPAAELRVAVVESRGSTAWHPGMLWPSSRLQVSGVKDLVTLVDPRSRFSFLNFLHEHGRLYRHLVACPDHVGRREFDQYFRWAADLLGVALHEPVQAVEHDDRGFVVRTGRGTRRADHLVIGVGQVPAVPECARHLTGPRVWHASEHLDREVPVGGRRVLLVGGGQSAGEVAMDLLSGRTGLPARLTWVTGSGGFAPLDASPFANEWFNPRFVEYFREQSTTHRARLLDRQQAASCGITGELLAQVYRRLYELDYLSDNPFRHELLAGARLTGISAERDGFRAVLTDTLTGAERETRNDLVVLATGYGARLPDFMAPLRDRLPVDGDAYAVGRDYRVHWDGPDTNRIYVQNGARHSHGIADPNLGLVAWRSAVIINSLLDREHYSLKRDDITLSLDWQEPARVHPV